MYSFQIQEEKEDLILPMRSHCTDGFTSDQDLTIKQIRTVSDLSYTFSY